MNYKTLTNLLLILFLFTSIATNAQYLISGSFPKLAGQTVRLTGFEGFGIYNIDSAKVSENGTFTLKYATKDRGMGYLNAKDKKAYFVVFANENISLKGELLSIPESVICTDGNENKLFVQYATQHPKREQALSAWDYLKKMYQRDSLFIHEIEVAFAINNEITRIKEEDSTFIAGINPQSYVSWFLPTRKLVSSVSNVAKYRTDEIPETINEFRKLDYTDHRLYKSGLFKDAIDNHFWLLENMGQPLETVFKEMCTSIDFLLTNLEGNEQKLNQITDYLFDLLERHSLFQASEYLALKALTQNSCTLNDDLAKQLETYRAMKNGNMAPDILFLGNITQKGVPLNNLKRLFEVESTYKVVVFGASWCPKCTEEIAQIPKLYGKWKSKGVEVVFISLDSEIEQFKSFTQNFPFISFCDFKKWETQSAKDYYVFATPTIFILDSDLKIILRPNSVRQIEAWVDFNVGKNVK